jgi:drug/metabolite transporter (DMT)-like permease
MGFHHPLLLGACIPLGTALTGIISGGLKQRAGPKTAHIICGAFICAAFWLGAAAQGSLSSQDFLVGKAARLLPTMLLGVLFLNRRFSAADWSAACLAVVGLCCVLVGCAAEQSGDGENHPPWRGYGLLLTSLFLDSMYANIQENLVKQHGASAAELAACGMGVASVFFGLMAVPDSGTHAGLHRVATEPPVLLALLLFTIANVIGSVSGLNLVANFGAASAGFASVVAKSVSLGVLLVLFPRQVPPTTFVGIALVFGAVVLTSAVKVRCLATSCALRYRCRHALGSCSIAGHSQSQEIGVAVKSTECSTRGTINPLSSPPLPLCSNPSANRLLKVLPHQNPLARLDRQKKSSSSHPRFRQLQAAPYRQQQGQRRQSVVGKKDALLPKRTRRQHVWPNRQCPPLRLSQPPPPRESRRGHLCTPPGQLLLASVSARLLALRQRLRQRCCLRRHYRWRAAVRCQRIGERTACSRQRSCRL